MKPDLRVKKTKKNLQEALLTLMEQYPFNQIKIVMVVREAGVMKNTFYRHYDTLFDLYQEMMELEIKKINEMFYDRTLSRKEMMLQNISAIKESVRFWRIALKETSPNVLMDMLVRYYEDTAREYYGGRPDVYFETPVAENDEGIFRQCGCANQIITIRYVVTHMDKSPKELQDIIHSHCIAHAQMVLREE